MTNLELQDEKVVTKTKEQEEQEDTSQLPGPFEEILEYVPEQDKEQVERLMMTSIKMGMSSPEHEVMKKINSEHIDKYLSVSEEEMKNSYAEKRDRKIYHFLLALAVGVFFIIVIVLLKDNPEIMEKVIYTIGGLIAGAFGGYGVGRSKEN